MRWFIGIARTFLVHCLLLLTQVFCFWLFLGLYFVASNRIARALNFVHCYFVMIDTHPCMGKAIFLLGLQCHDIV